MDGEREVVKWYTRARKFPQLIGRTHDGTRIPGGPYTYTQFIGGFACLLVGTNTIGWWGRFGTISNIGLLGIVTYATVWLLGRAPIGARNPLSVATAYVRALTRPRIGTVRGHPPRPRRPRRLRHRVVISATTLANPRGAGVTQWEAAAPVQLAELSHVQRALAASTDVKGS